jgi:hypothetical protein
MVSSVSLRIGVTNLVSADIISLALNGKSLDDEHFTRSQLGDNVPYNGQWVDVDLRGVRPAVGKDVLDFTLASRVSYIYNIPYRP